MITQPTLDIAAVVGLAIDQGAVVDVDAAFVQPFTPAIAVTKTADKAQLEQPGPVTYTYNVRNTGDVPLSNVAERITDDKCSPVTYVSGDEDGDGLLDTPTSIFEDSADEIWVFTCTATIAVTTVNTVVVTGTPVDPEGKDLCVDPAPGPNVKAAAAGCDVSATAQAKVEVAEVGANTLVPPLPPTGARVLELLLLGVLLLWAGAVLRGGARRQFVA